MKRRTRKKRAAKLRRFGRRLRKEFRGWHGWATLVAQHKPEGDE